jgi:hypothetical protein
VFSPAKAAFCENLFFRGPDASKNRELTRGGNNMNRPSLALFQASSEIL